MNTEDQYKKARKRVKKKKAFYQHFSTYAIVSLFLVALNLLTSPNYFWFFFPVLGWGVGIASHYMAVFGFPGSGKGSAEWEEREISKEMEALQKKHETPLDLDDHLELREIDPKKEKIEDYRDQDFV